MKYMMLLYDAPNHIPTVTDGPYAEAKEQLGGYLLLDVEHRQRAVDIASNWPAGLASAIELRPLTDQEGS